MHYQFLKKDEKAVIVFSKYRVPFGKTKTDAEIIGRLKQDIKQAVEALRCDEDESLQARYGEIGEKTVYDVENVLFYNFGTASFAKLMQRGVNFSVAQNEEVETLRKTYNLSDEYTHYYEYALVKTVAETKFENVLAEWKNIPLPCVGLKPAQVWRTLKENADKICVKDRIATERKDTFAMALRIEKPQGQRFCLSSSIKPLLDGLVCALHSSEFAKKDLALIVEKLQCDNETLLDERIAVLGEREKGFVRVYPNSRNKVTWNPADDLCKYVSVTVEEGTAWNISGTVYSTVICPYCGKSGHTTLFESFLESLEELDNPRDSRGLLMLFASRNRHFCKLCKKGF